MDSPSICYPSTRRDTIGAWRGSVLAMGLAAMLVALPGVALADNPAEAEGDDDHEPRGGLVEELILGESPYPQDAGEFQLTFSVEHLSGSESDTTDLVFGVEYGLTDFLQFGFEIPYRFVNEKEDEEDANGLGDVGFSVLVNPVRESWLVLSGAVEITVPTGDEDKELGEGVVEVEPSILAAVPLGAIELYGGVGGEFTKNGEAFTYSAGVAAELIGPVVGLVEFAGVVGTESNEDTAFVSFGVSAEAIEDVTFMFGVPVGLNDDSADWGLTFRAIAEF